MQRRNPVTLMSISLLLGFALWSVGRDVKANAGLAPSAMAMITLPVSDSDLALPAGAVQDAEGTARHGAGTTTASRRTDLPADLREAVEKSRYRIRPSERAADAGAYESAEPRATAARQL